MEHFRYKYDELFNPVLQSPHKLGGCGTNNEIEEQVTLLLGLSDAEIEDIHRGNGVEPHLAFRAVMSAQRPRAGSSGTA